jgi:hypothetical protein
MTRVKTCVEHYNATYFDDARQNVRRALKRPSNWLNTYRDLLVGAADLFGAADIMLHFLMRMRFMRMK